MKTTTKREKREKREPRIIPPTPTESPTETTINRGSGVETPSKRKLQFEAIYEHAERISNEITEFNPKMMVEEVTHPYCIFLASRRSGKTWTLRDMLYNAKHKWENVILFSNTKDFNVDYGYIPDENKHTTAEMKGIIEDIILQQKQLKKDGQDMKDYLFILDDVLDDNSIRKRNDNIVQTLSTQGRHLHLSVCLLVQGSKGVTPMIRKNTDFVFISRGRDGNEMETFLKTYLTGESEASREVANQQRLARAIYSNIVDKHDFGFLVIHNTKQNTKGYKDFLYWYVANAKPPPPFSIIKKERKERRGEKDKYDTRFEMSSLFRPSYTIKGTDQTAVGNLTVGLLKLTKEEEISKSAMKQLFRGK